MDIFKGKTAIVTGAASGIGRALSERLARKGARVVMADVNTGQLENAAAGIEQSGGNARAATLDVRDFEAVKGLVDDTVSECGRLDYIFNNAGTGVGGEARDFDYEDWKKVIDINLYGVVNGVAAAYPLMVKQGSGHIVNTASLAGLIPLAGEISYTTSKYAIVGLSHALRAEAADLGVKVSVVCPGKIETPIYHTSRIIGFDREKALGILPGGISPDRCAGIILRGVARNKATIVVTRHAKLLWILGRTSPALTVRLMELYMRRMREFRIED